VQASEEVGSASVGAVARVLPLEANPREDLIGPAVVGGRVGLPHNHPTFVKGSQGGSSAEVALDLSSDDGGLPIVAVALLRPLSVECLGVSSDQRARLDGIDVLSVRNLRERGNLTRDRSLLGRGTLKVSEKRVSTSQPASGGRE